jgi:hypothetical protein
MKGINRTSTTCVLRKQTIRTLTASEMRVVNGGHSSSGGGGAGKIKI